VIALQCEWRHRRSPRECAESILRPIKPHEAPAMIDERLETDARTRNAGRATQGVFLGLRRCGLSIEQAGNLIARLEGLHGVPGGWSVEEVQRLRFARWMFEAGRIGADDAEPRHDALAAS
jgi:hypothetical protein